MPLHGVTEILPAADQQEMAFWYHLEPDEAVRCGLAWGDYRCGRHQDHPGRHVAFADKLYAIAMWSEELGSAASDEVVMELKETYVTSVIQAGKEVFGWESIPPLVPDPLMLADIVTAPDKIFQTPFEQPVPLASTGPDAQWTALKGCCKEPCPTSPLLCTKPAGHAKMHQDLKTGQAWPGDYCGKCSSIPACVKKAEEGWKKTAHTDQPLCGASMENTLGFYTCVLAKGHQGPHREMK
jgi:hypothetical protein